MATTTYLSTTKPSWQSKTLWTAAVVAFVPLLSPTVAAYISANPTVVPAVLAIVFGLLRTWTKGALTIT